ncbi:MAG: pentapeptide repeat-containing protein [Theionarchaea archaeon]|nr:pentapeptide repeat-containing protein [Theionarchaea archaeon]
MGRCFYTWKELDEIGVCTEYQCPEEAWVDSGKYCIFHDPSSIKDTELFKRRLEGKLNNGDYNFQGYCFPEGWRFRNKEFGRGADFRGAIFQEDSDFKEVVFLRADFRKTVFKGDVDFSKAIFEDYANFNESVFQNSNFRETKFDYSYFQRATFTSADFWRARFQRNSDFSDAHFQNADFSRAIFEDYANFNRASFQLDADFWGAILQNANFSSATFQKNTDFRRTTFRNVDFKGTNFQEADFKGVTFQNADFRGSTFHNKVEVLLKNIEKIDLRNTEFLFRSYITANLTEILFHRAFIENVAFIDCTWPDNYVIYEEKHMKDKGINLSFNQLETIYRNLKQNIQDHGDYTIAGELYYREMEMKRKGSKKKKKRIWLEIYRLLAGYGEKPERTILSSFFTILLFALLYWVLGCLDYCRENTGNFEEIVYTLYFSFVTFTTLGLGDIKPLTHPGRILICCEAVIGAFLIALFVVVFARKMMR